MIQKRSKDLPELLAPAGNYEKLRTAIHYGADAVYLGGKEFSLRAKAGNFALDQMEDAIRYSHERGVRVFVTANIFAHERDFQHLDQFLLDLKKLKADGVIIADPGILRVARRVVPDLSVHLSTQANVTNPQSAQFWGEQGVDRLNLARELSLLEMKGIRRAVHCELEVFVHGAICISYSGRCMLSNYLTGRDANQGKCAHPCRFSYSLVEEKRPGEYFPVVEDDRGTYIFNSRDLCLLSRLPELVAAGVDSLKIEGRMKSIFYVGGVVRLYRAALDYLGSLPEDAWHDPAMIDFPIDMKNEIERLGTRGATENFFEEPPGPQEMIYDASRAGQPWEPVAVIRTLGEKLQVELRNTVFPGESIELMSAGLSNPQLCVQSMFNEEGGLVPKGNPGNILNLELEGDYSMAREGDILRRVVQK